MRYRLACLALVALVASGCGGGSSTPSTPAATPTPLATPTPVATNSSNAAFTCAASASAASAVRGGGLSAQTARRSVARHPKTSQTPSGLIAVSYDRATAQRSTAAIATREKTLGTNFVREFDFARSGVVTRILSVAPNDVASVTNALRAQAGVRSVGPAGARRYASAVTRPYFPNDAYFNGFTTLQSATPTYHVQPYSQNASVPGQWDMHAMRLEYAFGYSQASNGSGIVNLNALGSSAIKIAIVDTGQDSSHPELSGKIVYQKCFLTAPDNTRSTSNFSTDPDGHGTNVSGIAAAALGNNVGFVGAGGRAQIYAYRVFPTPNDNCLTASSDAQCSAASEDVVSAINDAVAAHVNVINLSLGGGACPTPGVDSDTLEGAAIANALAANIIVVASAGNDGNTAIESPACATGVIAAGASALADGQPNGAGNSSGSVGAPVEYVASYSNYGAAALRSAAAWGIVAPGGDPNGSGDSDLLHWIENVWTSTPVDSGFAGTCAPDFGGGSSTVDCRVQIAGTSMAAPHVAGAAALILAVNPSYQSPALMKQLLCTTADDIADARQGCGRLNVHRAMATALGDPTLP